MGKNDYLPQDLRHHLQTPSVQSLAASRLGFLSYSGCSHFLLLSVYGEPFDTHVSSKANLTTLEKEVLMMLIQIVMILIVVGVLLWLVNRFIPMQATIKSILNAVVVIAVVLWLLNVFGLFNAFAHIHVGN